jgi:hypothetical protein
MAMDALRPGEGMRRGLRFRHFQVSADLASQQLVQLAMPRYRRDLSRFAVDVNRVGAALAEELTPVRLEMPYEVAPLHAAWMRIGSRITS